MARDVQIKQLAVKAGVEVKSFVSHTLYVRTVLLFECCTTSLQRLLWYNRNYEM